MRTKKKFILWVVISVLIGFALGYLFAKGFFNNPQAYIQRVQSKFVTMYNDATGKEPVVYEEVITTADGHKVIIDKPKGYMLSLPDNMNVDLSISPEQIKAYDENMTLFITREWAPYEDPWYFIDNYMNNYYLNEHYIETNNITIRENITHEENGVKSQTVSLVRSPDEQTLPRQNEYTYFFIESATSPQSFFRIMFKYHDYEAALPVINEIKNSFEEIAIEGENTFKYTYAPDLNNSWSDETRSLYNSIKTSDDIKWGIFVDGAYSKERNYNWLVQLEEKVDYKFDFALHYVNLDWGFPVEEMQKFYDDGKITELTLQVSNHNNDDLFGKNINFDMYDGLLDEQIREFARGAKQFGHPFLFRLNNEMNSDWVNYSGVAALSDPEIFIENWRRIYEIFEEEGVDNAIWIFNPNAEDCPPARWNSYISYYPGNSYVHMIGMTGYNTGEYYKELYHEKWRTFDEIYQAPYDKYMKVFSNFPFIITEFASSSVGGDKPAWIRDMFEQIKKYDNIKMALWWSSADYDMRPETYKQIARPYFLDETDETAAAFREGVAEYKKD